MTISPNRAQARQAAVATATSRKSRKLEDNDTLEASEYFGENVFTFEQMRKTLNEEDIKIYRSML